MYTYRCQNCGPLARPSAAAPTAVSSLSRLGGAEPLSGKCSNINILFRPAPAHVTAEQQILGTLWVLRTVLWSSVLKLMLSLRLSVSRVCVSLKL